VFTRILTYLCESLSQLCCRFVVSESVDVGVRSVRGSAFRRHIVCSDARSIQNHTITVW